MLVIRLQRTGRENLPTYRLVVAEKARPVKGKYVEIVGHYLPERNPVVLEKKDERIKHWIKNGAMPSDTVARLLKRAGIENMDKFIRPYTKRKSKKKQAEAPPNHPKPLPVETPKTEGETVKHAGASPSASPCLRL
ncbi:30S ribosomal protein S16 [Candidatus Peregrinibacteria bacterium]|nr:30S ribosomal protein S16 [Candidatus Peregrinibacteria bacterium]